MELARFGRSILISASIVWGGVATAQSTSGLESEKNRLARLEQSLENRAVEVEDYENELLALDYKLNEARQDLAGARKNYEDARVELTRVEREHATAASKDTERQLRKAKHAFAMAERGVDSRRRRVDFFESNQSKLKAEQEAASADMESTKARIEAQKSKVETLVADMLARAEAAKRAPKPAVAVTKPSVPAPTVAAVTQEPAEAAMQQPVESGVEREIDPDLLAYVTREQNRMSVMLEKSDTRGQRFKELTIRFSDGERIALEYLGHNHYRAVAPVKEGVQTFEVKASNTWKFRRTIPAEDADEPYVFILDARRVSRPRLIMYPEYALSFVEE